MVDGVKREQERLFNLFLGNVGVSREFTKEFTAFWTVGPTRLVVAPFVKAVRTVCPTVSSGISC
jgi:hypothetical protein